MIKNYLKLSWRTLLKNKMFSLIIISGLALGYASCILIYLHVRDELSYDQHNKDSDRIYRVVKDFVNDDGTFLPDATTPPALAYAIKQEIPEVDEAIKLISNWGSKSLVKSGDKIFYEEGRYRADSGILNIFTYKFLEGDQNTALNKPNSVVITQSMQKKYFGNEKALGKTMEIGSSENNVFTVTGVIEDIPENSHFHFDLLLSQPTEASGWNSNWGWYNWYTYIKIKPDAVPADVEQKIIALFKKHNPESSTRYYIQPLNDIHLHSKLKWELEANGDITFVKIFIIVGIFILLIASINYINLSISQGFNRSREVGIRKVSGAHTGKLIYQFLTESILTSLVSVLVAIALVESIMPLLNEQFGKNIPSISAQPAVVLVGILLSALGVGIISGLYPALYLSGFKPIQVLKGIFQPGHQNLWLRKGLVVLQFTISIALIAGTLLVVRQVNYVKDKSLGFSKDQVIIIENTQYLTKSDKLVMKNTFSLLPQVVDIGTSNGILGGQNWTTMMASKGSENSSLINFSVVDYDYLNVMGLQFIQGRNYSKEFPSDTISTIIINETAVRDLGIKGDPIGALISDNPGDDTLRYRTVIGVVKDFHFASLRNEIKPYAFYLEEGSGSNFAVKINTDDISGTLNGLKKAWNSVAPDRPFEYFFLDETFQQLYSAEENFQLVFSALAFMAIYIACAGLFAIAAFFIKRRTKEIGIRKVMGASVAQITWLVSAEFIFIVMLANLIAWPVAWYFMDNWLNGFAYRISIGWSTFLFSGVIALLIAALTVSYQSIRSAFANPVDSLRNE